MRSRRLTLIMGLLALTAPASAARADTAPTLGLKQASATWGAGFGVVKPHAVDFNGDPTSSITRIHWASWGGASAVGHGVAGFTWPGFAVADGTRYVAATVVAFDRGTCAGQPAYQREEWYFPQYGQTFAPASAGFDLCTGKLLKQAPYRGPVYCPKGQFNTWVAGSVTCAQLPGIEALVGGGARHGHSAKWISHGWVCGTDLRMGNNPQTVDCQSGNSNVVNFTV